MDNYNLFRVWGDSDGVRLYTTDPTELDWMVSELKKIIPLYFIKPQNLRIKRADKLPSGETYCNWIDRLSFRDYDVLWWVIKQLCARGWEPLGAMGAVYGGGTGTGTEAQYLFRRKG